MKSLDKVISNFLEENDINTEINLEILKSVFLFGVNSRSRLWHAINDSPKVTINRQICVLTKYGRNYDLETIFSSDFEEYIKTHTCLMWLDLYNLMRQQ